PLLGTAAFLAVSLSQNLHHIQHAEHFQGRTAAQVFQPVAGLKLTARTLVDNLVLGVGAFGTTCPGAAVPAVGLLLVLAARWLGGGGVGCGRACGRNCCCCMARSSSSARRWRTAFGPHGPTKR